jgi:SlyX protein
MTSPSRLDDLEIRIAHQDETIEQLNAAVTAQWAVIDRLTRELERLADRAEAAERANPLRPGDEPPPPHW